MMFCPQTSPDTHNAIFSPESADGVTHCDWRDGQMPDQSGPGVVRANLSARQAKALGLLTSGTYGQRGSTSLSSAALQSFLVSRLKQQLSTAGSTLFNLTWKDAVTPSGRRVSLLRASVRRTSDQDCGSWPTPRHADGEKNVRTLDGSLREIERKGGVQDLNQAAVLAGRVSPTAQDNSRGTKPPRPHDTGIPLSQQCAGIQPVRLNGFWRDADWLSCRDGKWRPVEPGSFPLVDGSSQRVGRLRAYGNAIVPQVAEAVIRAYLES